MHPTRRLVALSLAFVGLSGWASVAPASADGEKKPEPARKPFLWVVEGEPRIYLFGTIHIPDDRVLALPEGVKQAIAASEVVLTEVPAGAMDDPVVKRRRLLPPDKKLADVLPKETLDRLHAYLEACKVPANALDHYRPWAIAGDLPIVDNLAVFALKQPMDTAIPVDAKQQGKECAALETVEEQLAIFESLSDAMQAKFVATTIDQLESAKKAGRDPVQELIDVYLSGDETKMFKHMQEASVTGDDDTKAFTKRLIEDRNLRLVDRLLEEANKRPGKTIFLAVGAAHFGGNAGIPALLEKKGKKVRRITAVDAATGKPEPAPKSEPKPASDAPKPVPEAPKPQPAPK